MLVPPTSSGISTQLPSTISRPSSPIRRSSVPHGPTYLPMSPLLFVVTPSLHRPPGLAPNVSPLSPPLPFRRSPLPSLTQSPDSAHPPVRTLLSNSIRASANTTDPQITFSTGRAALSSHANSSSDTAAAAISTALQGLAHQPDAQPHFVHVTYSLDVDPDAVASELHKRIKHVPVIARSVNKKDTSGTVEVLLLHSRSPSGITFGSATVPVSDAGVHAAAESAAEQAARAALGTLADDCEFLVFAHSPAGGADVVRKGLAKARPDMAAYGGPAVGDGESGLNWTLFGHKGDEVVRHVEQNDVQTALVAAVSGSIPFFTLGVVKSWTQPKYVEKLPFMIPTYIGDAVVDLLTAIRYDDWDKFIWCIEDQGVDVNTKWTKKQNQSPLLAACSRARTRMIRYLLDAGADFEHRNDSGYTAVMYTMKLPEPEVAQEQLRTLEGAGARTKLTEKEMGQLGSIQSRPVLNKLINSL